MTYNVDLKYHKIGLRIWVPGFIGQPKYDYGSNNYEFKFFGSNIFWIFHPILIIDFYIQLTKTPSFLLSSLLAAPFSSLGKMPNWICIFYNLMVYGHIAHFPIETCLIVQICWGPWRFALWPTMCFCDPENMTQWLKFSQWLDVSTFKEKNFPVT